MPKQKRPDREPISDTFSGIISQFDNYYILSKTPLTSAHVVTEGDFVIRYGITYLGKPHYSIVPDMVVLDYGDMLAGEEAWEFLVNQSNLYPRSDVIGYRNDGLDEMMVIKQLDFAVPFDVLVYAIEDDHKPLVKVSVLITTEPEIYPERLQQYLPQYETLADWQASNE